MSEAQDVEMEEILPPDWEFLTLEKLRSTSPTTTPEEANKENNAHHRQEETPTITEQPLECTKSIESLATNTTGGATPTSGRVATISTSESTTSTGSSGNSEVVPKRIAGTIILKPKNMNKFLPPTPRPVVGPKGLDIKVHEGEKYTALQVIEGKIMRVRVEFDNTTMRFLPVAPDGHFTKGWSHIRHKGKFDQFLRQRTLVQSVEITRARQAEQDATTLLEQQKADTPITIVSPEPPAATKEQPDGNNNEMMDTSTSPTIADEQTEEDEPTSSNSTITTSAPPYQFDRQTKQEAFDFVTRFNPDNAPLDQRTLGFIGSIITLVTSSSPTAAGAHQDDGWHHVPSRKRGATRMDSRSRHDTTRAPEKPRKAEEHHYSDSVASKRPRDTNYSDQRPAPPMATIPQGEEEHQGDVINPADTTGCGDVPRVNQYNDESFHQSHFTTHQWENRLEGINRGTDCLFCTLHHYSDECPLYPLARHRAAVFRKHNRCICCRGYHFPLPCTIRRQRKVCTFDQCVKGGLVHDRLFCEVTRKERERARGINMPIGYDIRRAPTN